MNREAEIALDVQACRRQFPALSRTHDGWPVAYFDGPAGSQVPQRVIDAVAHYMAHTNANHGGLFATSRESDAMLAEAHRAVADLLGASDPGEVIFGANMTTLTLALSRSLARTWQPGDQVVVTQSDHDANVTPWVLAARDAGAEVRQVRISPADCTLDLDDLRRQLTSRTRLVAVGCASNATGTVHPVQEICRLAHEVGAEVFLDAVHYAPHLAIDVAAWNCDYLACSAYKFFGPHVGVLWGRREHLERLPAYKLRPVPDTLPDRWMTGTQSHESIAGTLAAIDYLADLGRSLQPRPRSRRTVREQAADFTGPIDRMDQTLDAGSENRGPGVDRSTTFNRSRRAALLTAYRGIEAYERSLLTELLGQLAELPEIKVWGIVDPARLHERVPTVCFTHTRLSATEMARRLAADGIFVWHGNYYALSLTEALGLEPEGAVRAGLLHYNTRDEVRRLTDRLHFPNPGGSGE
jgi:cysteine desulfurase family protein (TIGR01976 family)